MENRNPENRVRQHRRRIRKSGSQLQAVDFFNTLTGDALLDVTESCLPEHRERLYPPTVTLSMFMKQVLDDDGSCQQAVNAWAVQRAADGLKVQSVDTGAYCKARQRLPLAMVQRLTQQSGRLLNAEAESNWRWRGRVVKLVDGTGLSMPDTAENQRHYPQSSNQAPGVGFPLARMVGVVCLATGAVLDVVIGRHQGKGHGELSAFRDLEHTLEANDVLLGDALYCHYFLIAHLHSRGVDLLFQQNGSRITDFRRGEKLGTRDHRVRWAKPGTRPDWMSLEHDRAYPNELIVREVKVGGRILVTTMLDARAVPKGALSALYALRWNIELDLRNIKTTLGMDVLRCQTPTMIEKELWVHLLAYTLIRLLMARAARHAGVHPREISFKHAVQLMTPGFAGGHLIQPECDISSLAYAKSEYPQFRG